MRKCGKNIVEPDRPQMTIWRTRTACWIPKATNTHSQYVLLITFSTATIVARSRLIVAYVRTVPVSFNTNKIHCYRIYIRINLDVYVLLFHNWTIKTYFSSNLQLCVITPLKSCIGCISEIVCSRLLETK